MIRSYTCESDGLLRNVASSEINTEDFMAAVDFLGLYGAADGDRIGIISICGLGGMAMSAVAVDRRVKAVFATSPHHMFRLMAKDFEHGFSLEDRTKNLERLRGQRWHDAECGVPAPGGHDF